MVFAVQQGDRHVYCSSPHCIGALLKSGWRLSDSGQLAELVRELATPPPAKPAHQPSDHLA